MAGKWKMAEAFGRALQRASVDGGKAEKYINAARRVGKTNPAAEGKFQEGVIKGANDAIDAGKAADEAEEIGIDLGKTLEDRTGGYIDAMNDARTDKALQRDFEKAFDDAVERHGYKKWREESKDAPLDDGFGGDMHDVNRMDAEQRVREEMIRDKHTLSDDEFIDKWFNK